MAVRAPILPALLIVAAALCALTGTRAHALEPGPSAIKAAFLYKFGFFVEWPSAAFAATDSPINLCIVGTDPFGAVLDETVKGRRVGRRGIAVRRLGAVSRDSGCHIVYLAERGTRGTDDMLATLRGSDVLTVTDRPADAGRGIINFVMRDNRVRFDIDEAAAASSGLTISSRLLNLALDVKPRN
jgi:hypothetical protein